MDGVPRTGIWTRLVSIHNKLNKNHIQSEILQKTLHPGKKPFSHQSFLLIVQVKDQNTSKSYNKSLFNSFR